MVGAAGSGKSTVVKKLLPQLKQYNEDVYVFSLDDVRLEMLAALEPEKMKQSNFYAEAFTLCNSRKEEFDVLVNKSWKQALTSNVVVVDNVNLTRKSRSRWVTDLKRKGYKITAVQVITPLAVAVNRQLTRGDKAVPADVVKDMYFRQQEVLLNVEADIIITIDGTGDCSSVDFLITAN